MPSSPPPPVTRTTSIGVITIGSVLTTKRGNGGGKGGNGGDGGEGGADGGCGEGGGSVKNYLVDNKVNGDRIKATGFGEDEPLHKCVTDEACSEEQHQLNRRTTFVLSGGNFKIESIKPDFVKVDPRPGSAYYKQIDESTGVVSEKKAFSMLLQEKPEVTMPGLKFRPTCFCLFLNSLFCLSEVNDD